MFKLPYNVGVESRIRFEPFGVGNVAYNRHLDTAYTKLHRYSSKIRVSSFSGNAAIPEDLFWWGHYLVAYLYEGEDQPSSGYHLYQQGHSHTAETLGAQSIGKPQLFDWFRSKPWFWHPWTADGGGDPTLRTEGVLGTVGMVVTPDSGWMAITGTTEPIHFKKPGWGMFRRVHVSFAATSDQRSSFPPQAGIPILIVSLDFSCRSGGIPLEFDTYYEGEPSGANNRPMMPPYRHVVTDVTSEGFTLEVHVYPQTTFKPENYASNPGYSWEVWDGSDLDPPINFEDSPAQYSYIAFAQVPKATLMSANLGG